MPRIAVYSGGIPGGAALPPTGGEEGLALGKRSVASHYNLVDGWKVARADLPYRLRCWIPSKRTAINSAVDEVCRLADRCGCPEDRLTDLEIALREALANAISHGNNLHPGRRVFLRCYAGPGSGILVAVRDEGQGFDPDTVPDPRTADRMHLTHGRGLMLMRELMDHLEFRRGGSEVVLLQKLS